MSKLRDRVKKFVIGAMLGLSALGLPAAPAAPTYTPQNVVDTINTVQTNNFGAQKTIHVSTFFGPSSVGGADFTQVAGTCVDDNGLTYVKDVVNHCFQRTSNLADHAFQVGAPTGGDTGGGTINAETVNQQGVQVVDLSSSQTVTNKIIDAGSNTITNLTTGDFASGVIDPDPSLAANSNSKLATQAATKSYVDNASFGLNFKNPVNVATTANITLSGEQTIDGVLTSSSRVLVKNQSDQTQNGLYTSSSGAWTRTTDADTGAELKNATTVVLAGTENTNTQWNCACANVTIGVTPIIFTQISGSNTYTAGTGLQLSANQFSIDSTVVTKTGTQTLTNKTLTLPVISGIVSGGNTMTVPAATDTFMGRNTTDTMTNKSFTVASGSTAVTLASFGNRSLSLLDFNGVPDWTTDSTAALVAAETAALAAGIHVIRLDPSPAGSGYVIHNHTVPAGMFYYCPGGGYVQPANNDFRNFPNAVILTGATGSSGVGLKWSTGSGLLADGNCNFLHPTLAGSAPPTNQQENYTRVANYTGTAFQVIGDTPYFTGGTIIGFQNGIKSLTKTTRGYNATNMQVDAINCWDITQANEGLQAIISDNQCRPMGTNGISGIGNKKINLSGLTDNGSGELHYTFASPCNTGDCPLDTYQIWITSVPNAQSAQGGWVTHNTTTTGGDLLGSDSAFLTGKVLVGSTAAGSYRVQLAVVPASIQIKKTQSISDGGICIPVGAKIEYIEQPYGLIFLDRSVTGPATCTAASENITITDGGGTLNVDDATLVNAGTSYTSGDILTLVGGTFTDGPATILVDSVDDVTGAIVTFEIQDGGDYTALPSNPVSVTGGTGTGATFNVSSNTQLVMTGAHRDGTCMAIHSSNDIKMDNDHCMAHSHCVITGPDTSRVTSNGFKCDSENYLQDDHFSGITFAQNTKTVSFVNCGIYYFNHQVVDASQTPNAQSNANSVSNCDISSNAGSGYNRANLEVISPTPGTPKNKGIIYTGNMSGFIGNIFVSDDAVNSNISNNSFVKNYFYCQSDATTLEISGAGNAFKAGSCPVFALTPNVMGVRIAPSSTTTVYLDNSQCGEVISSSNAGGTLPVVLPAVPAVGCVYTMRATTNSITIDPNGNPIRGVLTAAQTSPVTFTGQAGVGQFKLSWNQTEWQSDGGTPDALVATNLGNGQRRAHGQVSLTCVTCSGGTAQLQLCPVGGPGGLIINNVVVSIPDSCIKLDNSVFAGDTSVKRYVYATSQLGTVSAMANNGSGKVRLTLNSTVGFNTGDPITCANFDSTETPAANVINDANTTLVDSTHIDLTDITFVATGNGSCSWVGMIENGNTHSTVNGVEVRSNTPGQTLVGMVYVDASHNLNDTATSRTVASWFNRKTKTCVNSFTADRTTTATSYAEINAEIECTFVTWGTDDVGWSISGMMGNGTVSDGSAVSAGFDSTTVAQTEESAYVNATATSTSNAAVRGSKTGLSEDKHFITLLGKSITGGTSTYYGSTPHTSLEAVLRQ